MLDTKNKVKNVLIFVHSFYLNNFYKIENKVRYLLKSLMKNDTIKVHYYVFVIKTA